MENKTTLLWGSPESTLIGSWLIVNQIWMENALRDPSPDQILAVFHEVVIENDITLHWRKPEHIPIGCKLKLESQTKIDSLCFPPDMRRSTFFLSMSKNACSALKALITKTMPSRMDAIENGSSSPPPPSGQPLKLNKTRYSGTYAVALSKNNTVRQYLDMSRRAKPC